MPDNTPHGYPPTMDSKWDDEAQRWYEPGNPLHIQPKPGHVWQVAPRSQRKVCVNCGHYEDEVGTACPAPQKAIRLPTREEQLADSRRGLWRPIDSRPPDRVVLVTRQVHADAPGPYAGSWLIARVLPGTDPTTYIHGRPATHWCEDTIGSPVT